MLLLDRVAAMVLVWVLGPHVECEWVNQCVCWCYEAASMALVSLCCEWFLVFVAALVSGLGRARTVGACVLGWLSMLGAGGGDVSLLYSGLAWVVGACALGWIKVGLSAIHL